MIKEMILIREILGPSRGNVCAMAYAVWEAERLLFQERIPLDDIRVTKDIYPEVARKMKKSHKAVSHQIERVGNLCWDRLDEEQKKQYIGKVIKDIQAPSNMIFYLAFYSYFKKPYYEILRKCPSLLF